MASWFSRLLGFWLDSLVSWDQAKFIAALKPIGVYLPGFWIGDLWNSRSVLIEYFSIILPMGLFNLIGSLQNLESAEAAGDTYPAGPYFEDEKVDFYNLELSNTNVAHHFTLDFSLIHNVEFEIV